VLELRNISKSFGETIAVDGVSLTVARGEMVGVIGRSGSGKSTLLRLINRLAEPSSGEVLWDGEGISRLKRRDLRKWRRRCAMIFQQFNLSPRLDVITNVLIGVVAERPLAMTLMKFFPASDRADAIRELDALDMGQTAFQRAGTLSGGQQQRVAIARAMMQKPDMILADEPVASLDPGNAEVVMKALQAAAGARGIPVLVSLHSLDLARRYCTRIVAMSKGRIIFDGSPSELSAEIIDRIYAAGANRNPAVHLAEVGAAA
jgi:phosphonate transport system ATP-binding protein